MDECFLLQTVIMFLQKEALGSDFLKSIALRKNSYEDDLVTSKIDGYALINLTITAKIFRWIISNSFRNCEK